MIHLLTFNEIYKERIWGGRSLEGLFGKGLPPQSLIGESWELVDLPEDKSVVAQGPATGKNLGELVKEWKGGLLGSASLENGQFPLLIKFLDANDILSVQVHPDYEGAKKLGGSVRAKYECWYVLEAEEDAYVYLGIKPGTTKEKIWQALMDGTLAALMVKRPAKRGDFFYLPGGVVHAIGSGLVIAEVQTPSDTTFRLYDWKRVDTKTGRPRELHVDQAMECLRLEPTEPVLEAEEIQGRTLLARAPTFYITKVVQKTSDAVIPPIGEPLVWIFLEGSGRIYDGIVDIELQPGKVLLIPAGAEKPRADFTSHSTYLEVKLTR
jgi:mannose-6-phosphate isomerase